MQRQYTLKKQIECSGIGLHSGKIVNMRLIPSEVDSGIVFRRTDISANNIINASFKSVVSTTLCTVIANGSGVSIATVEHLLAAIWGAGIDNIIIEVNAAEVPIMDGSSEIFIKLIESVGTLKQNKERNEIVVTREFEFSENGSHVIVTPSDKFEVSMEINFNNKVIGIQNFHFASDIHNFKKHLCRARTFGFIHEVEMLKEKGLALGGSLDNAIVVGEDNILNAGGLRYNDEFVRHKVLDFIGDSFVSGYRFRGHFKCYKSGHRVNNMFFRNLLASKFNWQFSEQDTKANYLEFANPAYCHAGL